MAVEIRIDHSELDEAMRRLESIPYALQRAVYPAVSEVLQGVRDHLADYLTSDVPLPDKLSRKAIRLSGVRLEGGVVVGEVSVTSASIPLIYYDVEALEITARTGIRSKKWPGFTFALRTGERRQSSERAEGKGLPFIARMPGGHLGVYFRPGYQSGVRQSGLWGKGKRGVKAHDAVKQAYGPRVQYHVATPEVEQSIINRANEAFPVILAKYVDQAIETHGGES